MSDAHARTSNHWGMSEKGVSYRCLTCNAEPSQEAKAVYAALFPRLAQEAQAWHAETFPANQGIEGWDIYIHPTNGVYIDYLSQSIEYSRPIVVPRVLDQSFSVGWQHRSFRTFTDPKYDIAERLIKLVQERTELQQCLLEETSTDAADLGDDRFDDTQLDDEGLETTEENSPSSSGDVLHTIHEDDHHPDYTGCSPDCGYCGHCPS